MVTINKADNNKCWWGVQKCDPSYIVTGNIKWCIHYKKQFSSFPKLNIRLPKEPAILLLDIYTREIKTCLHQAWHRNVPNKQVTRYTNVVYPYNRIPFNKIKEGTINTSYITDELKNIRQRERSQIQETTYYMILFIWSIQKRQIYRHKID